MIRGRSEESDALRKQEHRTYIHAERTVQKGEIYAHFIFRYI